MSNPKYKAKVKATGKEIEVYKQFSTGKYIDYHDCKTIYNESDLTIDKSRELKL